MFCKPCRFVDGKRPTGRIHHAHDRHRPLPSRAARARGKSRRGQTESGTVDLRTNRSDPHIGCLGVIVQNELWPRVSLVN